LLVIFTTSWQILILTLQIPSLILCSIFTTYFMVHWKKIYTDSGFWILLGWNIFLVYYQYIHPEEFKTILWIYWAQSIIIGLFNFADILTLQKVEPGSWKENDNIVSDARAKGCASFFFLFHYGFFHLAYVVFIFAFVKTEGLFDFNFFILSVAAFLISQLIWFIKRKTTYAKVPGNIGKMFILPYLRVVPMHLTILLPAFTGVSAITIFLLLKTLVDVIFYITTGNQFKNNMAGFTG
jgi:Family of unknown function (DUF6498)